MRNDDEAQALPNTIPIFPLRGAILLPRAQLPLNIFEPRYLSMVEQAMAHRRLIGMVRPRHDDDVDPNLYDVGCAGRITSFMETGDGRFLITLTGVSRFRIESDHLTPKGFRQAAVDWSGFTFDLHHDPEGNDALRERIIDLLVRYLENVGLSADWDSIEGASAETIVNSGAMTCPFEPDEKQSVLEAPTVQQRGETLI
ncbi:MAG: LON peptidase substrate-binding domain-containing protein, partial [Parvularculaceae bacterium]|nr:LON peptidase substrate-binding domain-containing protein [Parvularculaceae bacterium]